MQRIEMDQDFTLPVERVYAYLAEHENLEAIFGAKIARVRDGETARNGVGSVRQLRIAILPPFEETVTKAVDNELIEYKITKGSPLRDHVGTMTFSTTPTGSHLHYVIQFGAVLPGLDKIVAIGLERAVRKGLATVESKA
jgi:uncharacterized protein YndB with AHSA1/START domain